MNVGVTAQLAEFSTGLKLSALPSDIIERAKRLTLDIFGCTLRGPSEVAFANVLYDSVDALGFGKGNARVLGDPVTRSPMAAALLNSAFAHALDFDDTHAAATLHPGAPVIPAALAAGEMVRASGSDVLAGIIAGYEATCRIALALPAGAHYARGFHPSATCGAFGAAVAAGRILGLNGAEIASAMGIALSQSAGSLQFLVNGAWTKPFQVGWAAMSGLMAAQLASRGFRGASDALEGRHGFLQGYAPEPHPARVIKGLGSEFELMVTGLKPYPSCRYGHAGIDAVLALRMEHGLQPDDIDAITYGTSKAGMLLVGAPIEIKRNPQNIVDAQFSAPFVLSAALVDGRVGWSSYRELDNPVIRDLLSKVSCEADPEIEAEFPANMSGKITIDARGQKFVKKVVVPLGEPGNFLSDELLLAKFHDLAEPILGADQCRKLVTAVFDIEKFNDINRLTALAATPD